MSGTRAKATKNLTETLQALISSLTPNGLPDDKKLSEEQVNALSDRLNQFLGPIEEGPGVQRNEKGQLLNEEGLPIIDISEPLENVAGPSHSYKPFQSEHDPPPLSSWSEVERAQWRVERDRIAEMLEEEEQRELMESSEREHRRKLEEVEKMDAESKAAAREMQKKMGKALLRNIAAQREKEEEERKKTKEPTPAEVPAQNGEPSCRKPKKSVSFANLPEDSDKPKPKPPATWGDISVAKLRASAPKAQLKTDILNKQPMKFDVIERVPGVNRTSVRQERDSDDESNPEEQASEPEEIDEDGLTPPLDGGMGDSDESTGHDEDSDEDEFDFSEARVQREIALEYIRLRESVGAEAQQAMSLHTHEGENEWDQPNVPLDATLASKPQKSGMSRFKAARRANRGFSGNTSISLGASVLPSSKSSTLQKAVRTGKLENGQLVGGDPCESSSEDEEAENAKRTLEMLKDGVVFGESSQSGSTLPQQTENAAKGTKEQESLSSSQPGLSTSKPSRFLAQRAAQRPNSEPVLGPSSSITSTPSPILDTVIERSTSKRTTPSTTDKKPETVGPQNISTFKKPPTVIPAPSVPPSQQQQRRPFATPLVKPDPAVLSNMIVESPSFPPPGGSKNAQSAPHALPLVSEVRESTRRAGMSEEEPSQRTRTGTGKVSRFKAERL
ncbi:uncharacterized protein FOMMEDRAFT_153270 [Fomitiporia mediterranea MF3/22]|uniref:uncharacterized protein n=1 Tax=Fomitiporia mediterranea (strain MF3/22) TaxID=694068 RepID=UPI00044098E7|nr:uncharacterized protein FOMMEDRAFT_153270 [Fomitiporia mediterranea MF3/22]EJD05924.1 hypothetical protein FOMMEDRAFT_153270 [Fomitiporia mediterranea MF3/22]